MSAISRRALAAAQNSMGMGYINVLQFAQAQGSDDYAGIAEAVRQAKANSLNLYIPRCELISSDTILLDQAEMKVIADPGATISFTTANKPAMELRADDVEVHGLRVVYTPTRLLVVGGADGVPLRDRHSGFYMANGNRQLVKDCYAENFNNASYMRGSYVSGSNDYTDDCVIDGITIRGCDIGVLYNLQRRMTIKRLRSHTTTFIQSSPPHAIYGTYLSNKPCYDGQLIDCICYDNPHSHAFKVQHSWNFLIDGLHAVSCPGHFSHCDSDDNIIVNCTGRDMYTADGVTNTGGIIIVGSRRCYVANNRISLRAGDDIASCYRVRDSNWRNGTLAALEPADHNVFEGNYSYIAPTSGTDGQHYYFEGDTNEIRNPRCITEGTVNKYAFNFGYGTRHKVILPSVKGTERIVAVQPNASNCYARLDKQLLDGGYHATLGFRDLSSGTASTVLLEN